MVKRRPGGGIPPTRIQANVPTIGGVQQISRELAGFSVRKVLNGFIITEEIAIKNQGVMVGQEMNTAVAKKYSEVEGIVESMTDEWHPDVQDKEPEEDEFPKEDDAEERVALQLLKEKAEEERAQAELDGISLLPDNQ